MSLNNLAKGGIKNALGRDATGKNEGAGISMKWNRKKRMTHIVMNRKNDDKHKKLREELVYTSSESEGEDKEAFNRLVNNRKKGPENTR